MCFGYCGDKHKGYCSIEPDESYSECSLECGHGYVMQQENVTYSAHKFSVKPPQKFSSSLLGTILFFA